MSTDQAGAAATSYQQQDIQSADPLQLIVRVHELGSMHLARTRAALAAGDLAAKGSSVHQVSRCISLLQSSLDKERGGEVADNLDRLYDYLHRRLNEGHLRNDEAAFAEIAEHWGQLGAAWREAAERRAEGALDAAASTAAAAAATP